MLNRLFGFFSAPPLPDNVRIVPAAEVRRWVDADEAVVIDVREAGEHAAEKIPGALNLPLSSFDPGRLPPIPEGKRLVLHCRSGQRCGMAAQRLVAAGYAGEIHRLDGGIMGWRAAGGPTCPGS